MSWFGVTWICEEEPDSPIRFHSKGDARKAKFCPVCGNRMVWSGEQQ